MRPYTVPLVNESGRTIGYGDRWSTHRTKHSPDGPVLGRKHVGITIACLDEDERIVVQLRKHRIFDKVWSLSGDTHPRKYKGHNVETLFEAAKRCAKEDLGITIKHWDQTLSVSYSAQDPRDPRYCENELLYVLVGKLVGRPRINRRNVYEFRSVELAQISTDSRADMKKRPIDRRYAPWVHAVCALPRRQVREAFQAR